MASAGSPSVQTSPAGPRAVEAVPPPDAGKARRRTRGWSAYLLRHPRSTRRRRSVCGIPGATAADALVRLCQARCGGRLQIEAPDTPQHLLVLTLIAVVAAIPIALAAPSTAKNPRVPSLEAFRRRPPGACGHAQGWPSSDTRHKI